METFKHTIDNEEFKLNTIIDTDIITFKFLSASSTLKAFNRSDKFLNDNEL